MYTVFLPTQYLFPPVDRGERNLTKMYTLYSADRFLSPRNEPRVNFVHAHTHHTWEWAKMWEDCLSLSSSHFHGYFLHLFLLVSPLFVHTKWRKWAIKVGLEERNCLPGWINRSQKTTHVDCVWSEPSGRVVFFGMQYTFPLGMKTNAWLHIA